MQEKVKEKSIDLMEDSEEAAIRSCHQEPKGETYSLLLLASKLFNLNHLQCSHLVYVSWKTCRFWQNPWTAEIKGKKQKKVVLCHLYAIHAKCVTIIPEDIQMASQYT